MVFFNFLGSSVNKLYYWSSGTEEKSNKWRSRILSALNEFFPTLVRLCVGLLEQDLAYRFGISKSTVSHILITWINFMYLQLEQIPLWPPRGLISANMPNVFKIKYPTTRVIIDATEITVEQPALPELQQLTFFNYKNRKTYKGLIGISPSGVSHLFQTGIQDLFLTRNLLDRVVFLIN